MTDHPSKEPSGETPFPGWSEFMAAAKRAGAAPGAGFLASVESLAAGVAERREQVSALIAQLTVFEQQLATFEALLQPVLAWSRAWVRMSEQAFDPFGLLRRDEQA